MNSSKKINSIPENYVRLEGSERYPSPNSRSIGLADPNEHFSVTIIIRRRLDGEPLPDFAHFLKTHPTERSHLSQEDFAKKYGASDEDMKKVEDFVLKKGLKIEETNTARRSIKVSGTAEQMNKAFAVTLGIYEHHMVNRKGDKPLKETYRGREGFIHIPKDLSNIIVGVFGLDNRSITKRNSADPPNTNPLSIETITQLYNFPSNSASGQTIGIFSEAGYKSSDISTSFGGSPPTVTDITVDASNNGIADSETTQDIVIAAKAAPGASIAVYFTTRSQQGWVDLINRVAHPNPGDPICSVLSSSFYFSDGDDQGTLSNESISISWINAITQAFQDAAIQGITVCIAAGDTGSSSKVGGGDPSVWGLSFAADGKAHVQYPGSDPWVLSVGGTTIGNINGNAFDEYVWNDPDPSDTHHWGTTGGGVSDFFGLPAYQNNANVPRSINDNIHIGRGVPDVAANASLNSGYTGITVNGSSWIGAGTSASAPLWAGLIARINAALGFNIGFINPALYAIGSSGFNDLTGSGGPADNSNAGVSGYPARVGWDACTGWGSPNGTALLNELRAIYNRKIYFIVDKSTFGKDEVSDVISTAGGLYTNVFWIVLEGFSIHQVGSITPGLSGAFKSIPSIHIFYDTSLGPQYESPDNLYSPQRIRFPYYIIFSSVDAFPNTGFGPSEEPLTTSISIRGSTLEADTVFQLTSGADPYFTNIDPLHNNAFYLSQDLRVFSIANGENPLPGGPTMNNNDPYSFIQNLIGFLNSTPLYTTPSPDPLNALPGQTGYETGDSSITPLNASNQQNYNFAIARVRLQDSSLSTTSNVRVFFRLFVAQSCDTDFQPMTTYKSTLGTSGSDSGKPVFPLPSGTGLMDPSGQSIQTIPFFATDANGTHDYDSTIPNANIRNISIPMGQDKTWAYYGCFMDVYNESNQSRFPGSHHCIVAEIAYDDTPIMNSNGVTMSPENSDKLAQRNLQITSSGNPSYPDTHRIPQAFDIRPSNPFDPNADMLLNYPDELMIDWGNTPSGSIANIYWPQIEASDIVKLASKLYGVHPLSAADSNTIKCPVVKGVTYIPIPSSIGKNFAGLFTIDLPSGIRVGQEYQIKVRRISSRQMRKIRDNIPEIKTMNNKNEEITDTASQNKKFMNNWRYVTGTFQITIPVEKDEVLLVPEETTLAVLKWRLEHMPPVNRWYPILERYVEYISKRVDGFGGNASSIKPSLKGVPSKQKPTSKEIKEYRGKVREVIYDCFGDFKGFLLEQCCCSECRFFESHEKSIAEIVLRACKDRLGVTVFVDIKNERIYEIAVHC